MVYTALLNDSNVEGFYLLSTQEYHMEQFGKRCFKTFHILSCSCQAHPVEDELCFELAVGEGWPLGTAAAVGVTCI